MVLLFAGPAFAWPVAVRPSLKPNRIYFRMPGLPVMYYNAI